MSAFSLDEIRADGTMTPEELAAIADGEDQVSDAEKAVLSKIAGDAGEEDDDDGDEGGEGEVLDEHGRPVKTDAAPAPAATDKPAPKADAPAAEEDPTPSPRTQQNTAYTVTLPADFKEQQEALKSEEAALRAKFKEGEIEVDDYEAQRDAIAAKRSELDRLAVKAEISQEMTAQQAAQAWSNTQAEFFAGLVKAGGTDYAKDTEAAQALNEEVIALANMPRHADKPMDWFLKEAHKRVMLERGQPVTPTPTPTPTPAASRKPALDALPKTLAQVPGGDGPGDVGSEFADLDNLSGDELEAAIGKMSAAQRERYAKGL